jgi:hypothetical protein
MVFEDSDLNKQHLATTRQENIRMLHLYNEILKEKKKSLCCQTSGNHALPPALLDTGCDRHVLSTVQDEVTLQIVIHLSFHIFCKFFISFNLFLTKTDYLESPSKF